MLRERVKMSSLAEGRNFELSLGKDAGDKTLVFVKLTDSALKSIEECVMPNKGIAVLNPVVQFHATSGVLKFPYKGKMNKSYGFTLSYVEGDGSQGSFECLHHQEMESLESLGAMLLKIQINAKEDTYEKTRVRMAAAEEENKKFCAKEIDASKSYVGKKVKVKRPVVSMLPKLCSPLYKSDRASYKPINEILSINKDARSYPPEETSNDENFGSHISRENTVKKVLNVGKDESAIKDSDNVPSEKRSIVNTGLYPSEPHYKKLKTTEKLFNSLDILDADDQFKSKKSNHRTSTKQQDLAENSVSINLNAENSSVRDLENERDFSLDACEEENVPVSDKFMCEMDNQNMLSEIEQDRDPGFASIKNLGENESYDCFEKQETQSRGATLSKNQENNSNDDKSDDSQLIASERRVSPNSQSPSSSSIDSLNSEKELELNENFEYPSDYSKLYVKITSQQQRDCYKSDFDADYEQYQILHSLVRQAVVKFATFENELKRYKPGTEEYKKIREQICQEYLLNANDQSYQNAYNKLHYLHEKLSHIKKLVLAYDQALFVDP